MKVAATIRAVPNLSSAYKEHRVLSS